MTAFQPLYLGQALFLVGGLLITLLASFFAHRYPSPFFRSYTAGFAVGFLVELAETMRYGHFDSPWLGLLESCLLIVSGACFWRAARQLRGLPPLPWLGVAGACLAVISAGLAATGVPANWIVPVGGLSFNVALVCLGTAFWNPPAGSPAMRNRWLALALIAQGLWPVVCPYPLLRGTGFDWIGFSGAGLLQTLTGVGLLTYLLDDALARFRAEQARSQQLKNEFVSIVSHELRTPLTSIVGYAEFLADGIGGPLSAEQREYVHRIQANGARLRRLVDDLLDFSLEERNRLGVSLREDDVAALVRTVVEGQLPEAARAGITLRGEIPPGRLPFTTDPERLQQAVANLLGNAIKYTPAGGEVTVRVTPGPAGVRIEVADTGAGIAPEALPHIFRRFYQGDGTREGAGLGLAITHEIAQALNGELDAESRPGEGTKFRLTLPA